MASLDSLRMDIYHIMGSQVTVATEAPHGLPAQGFLWLDATHDEVAADLVAWRNKVEGATGVHILDPHLTDATNLSHPTYFDSTQDYAMVVFRKLALNGEGEGDSESEKGKSKRKIPPALTKLATRPVTFLLMDRALITVHAPNSRTIEAARIRLLEQRHRRDGISSSRLPASAEELMLRLLNAMVDQYLELRQPLTTQIDRWQRALLNPRRPFNDWMALLDARIELHKLDHLCEGQHDALQELRDYLMDNRESGAGSDIRSNDLLLVRVNDVVEHITRVLNHARRLESSIESAVQIHFSAMAHRTSDIMRTLTVITALFMPLTLITGIFGMNFDRMPLLRDAMGFWITMAAMTCIVVVMLLYFRSKRYLEDRSADTD
ncbi:MAG: magnesium transporter CorA family protein [Noviherbaspirillum sp.]|nr:magnesium transporter CorA family protein [Noviherbaspirillum sp.]